jgi:hypothetical protein
LDSKNALFSEQFPKYLPDFQTTRSWWLHNVLVARSAPAYSKPVDIRGDIPNANAYAPEEKYPLPLPDATVPDPHTAIPYNLSTVGTAVSNNSKTLLDSLAAASKSLSDPTKEPPTQKHSIFDYVGW